VCIQEEFKPLVQKNNNNGEEIQNILTDSSETGALA
jgi:hypothetical protein